MTDQKAAIVSVSCSGMGYELSRALITSSLKFESVR